MNFQVGDKVVYPNQGVGVVEQISTRNLTGQQEFFYLLRLNANGLRVMVPRQNTQHVGLRRVARNGEIGAVIEYLMKGRTKMPTDWKCRFKENAEKMRNGSLYEVAEVLKTLLILNHAKPLSFREKKMLDRAWQLVVDEIAVARGVSKGEVGDRLTKVLAKANLRVPLPS